MEALHFGCLTCCKPHRYTSLDPATTVNCLASAALKTCGAVVCGRTRTGTSRGPAKRGIGTVAVPVGGAPQAVLLRPSGGTPDRGALGDSSAPPGLARQRVRVRPRGPTHPPVPLAVAANSAFCVAAQGPQALQSAAAISRCNQPLQSRPAIKRHHKPQPGALHRPAAPPRWLAICRLWPALPGRPWPRAAGGRRCCLRRAG